MLRRIGIPARVGTGFLVEDWAPDRGAYVVHARDAHAWVEVSFEGCGWVIFDPTPAAPADGSDQRPTPEDPRDAAEDEDVPSDDDAETHTLGDALDRVRDLLSTIEDWIADDPWPCIVAAALSATFLVVSMRSRARRLSGAPARIVAPKTPWDRVLAELARRGYRRGASQTATEFAASVVRIGGAQYTVFEVLTKRQQAARFGGGAATAADEAEMRAFVASLPPTH
jgi:hypothetical protein